MPVLPPTPMEPPHSPSSTTTPPPPADAPQPGTHTPPPAPLPSEPLPETTEGPVSGEDKYDDTPDHTQEPVVDPPFDPATTSEKDPRHGSANNDPAADPQNSAEDASPPKGKRRDEQGSGNDDAA